MVHKLRLVNLIHQGVIDHANQLPYKNIIYRYWYSPQPETVDSTGKLNDITSYPSVILGFVGRFGLIAPWDSISVYMYIGPSPRKREKERKMIDERENTKPIPPAPTACTVGPYATIYM